MVNQWTDKDFKDFSVYSQLPTSADAAKEEVNRAKTTFDKMFSVFPPNTTRFMVLSERELKRMEEIDLHNWNSFQFIYLLSRPRIIPSFVGTWVCDRFANKTLN